MRITLLVVLLIAHVVAGRADESTGGWVYHDELIEPDRLLAGEEVELRRFKKQALQSAGISAGSLQDLNRNGLSTRYLEFSLGSGIPLGSFDNILAVTPRVQIDWIDADPRFDIPSQLYEVALGCFYRRAVSERLSWMAIVSPSVRSDFSTSEKAFRWFALALANWEYIPDKLTLSGGAVYLGRADLPVLPAIGLTWTPSRITRLDLRFPSSRLSRRLAKNGGASETWAYLSAGIGGNTWAVTREETSLPDELSLRDLRLTAGIERLVDGGGGMLFEFGYAANRRLEYESDQSEVDLGDALSILAGWRY